MSKIQITPKQLSVGITVAVLIWGIFSISTHTEPAPEVNTQPQYEILKAEASDYESQAQKLEEEAKLKAQKAEALKKLAETEEAITNLDVEQKVSVTTIETPALKAQAVIEPQTDQRPAVEAYRAKYFPNSPVTTDMIMATSAKYNIPAGMILAFGHNESHMGTKGRAVQTRNPMNVGNTDAGDYKAVRCGFANNCLLDWQAGLDAFGSLISRCYFNEGEAINLQTMIDRDFRAVRCNVKGKRYQTDTRAKMKYEERIRNLKSFNITY